jgi:hypothetical protein
VVGHHVRRHDLLELAGALQEHVPPPVEQDRAVTSHGGARHQLGGGLHAVADGLLELVHRDPLRVGADRPDAGQNG